MFAITVEHEFCAAHALVIAGARETLHGHNFHVWVTVEGPTLDADGLLCDFHDVQRALRDATEPFTNRNLHECPPFTSKNPALDDTDFYMFRDPNDPSMVNLIACRYGLIEPQGGPNYAGFQDGARYDIKIDNNGELFGNQPQNGLANGFPVMSISPFLSSKSALMFPSGRRKR